MALLKQVNFAHCGQIQFFAKSKQTADSLKKQAADFIPNVNKQLTFHKKIESWIKINILPQCAFWGAVAFLQTQISILSPL